jgi:hypothetical protein
MRMIFPHYFSQAVWRPMKNLWLEALLAPQTPLGLQQQQIYQARVQY